MVRTRGNTPQAQVAPVAQGRAKRSTRSQSNEPSASTSSAAQTAKPKVTRRQGRSPSVNSADPSTDTRPSRGAMNKAAITGLSIVEEDGASDSEDEPAEVLKTPSQTADFSSAANPRISISGTTARSTASDEEPERLLLEIAPDLCNAAARILKVLTVPNPRAKTINIEDILREVRNPASLTGKQLWPLEQNFDILFKHFGDGFLDPQNIIEAMFNPQSLPPQDSKSWALTELINSANLAYLGKWVAIAQRDDDDTLDFLRDLDEVCPLPFLSSLSEEGSEDRERPSFGDSDLRAETFDFVLAVRTQVAVTAMIKEFGQDDFNPVDIINEVFWAPLASGGYSKSTVRAWDLDGLGSGQTGLLPAYEKVFKDCISTVRSKAINDMQAAEAGEYDIMQELTAEFSWTDFCVTVLEWIHERKQELDSKIMRLGGASTILDTVKHEIGVDATVLEPSPKKFDSFGSTLTEKSATTKKATKTSGKPGEKFHIGLKKYQIRHSGVGVEQEIDTPEPDPAAESAVNEVIPRSRTDAGQETVDIPQPGPATEPAVDEEEAIPHRDIPTSSRTHRQPTADAVADNWAHIEDFEDDTAKVQTQASQDNLARARKYQARVRQDKENLKQSQPAKPAKPRAFIDPQAEAERVEFDEASQGNRQSEHATTQRAGAKSRWKRPAPATEEEDDEEVSEDEGFQEDTRDVVSRSQQRRQGPAASRKTTRTEHQPSPPKRARTAPRASEPSSSRAPQDPSDNYEPVEDDDPSSTSHTLVKAMARRNVAMAKNSSGPRRRKAWTTEEEAHLRDLIAEYGTSWAELKKMDDAGEKLLVDRDQVALKDKARNMKMNFLCARLELPTNFQYVSLDKKGRDRLDALGIEY